MILKRKVDIRYAYKAIQYLLQHIDQLVDSKNIKSQKDDAVYHIYVFIEHLKNLEVSYPECEQIAMYLEFRKRFLISQGLHTESNISQIKELDVLFEYFNSNKGC